jgi:hypothetical protein
VPMYKVLEVKSSYAQEVVIALQLFSVILYILLFLLQSLEN